MTTPMKGIGLGGARRHRRHLAAAAHGQVPRRGCPHQAAPGAEGRSRGDRLRDAVNGLDAPHRSRRSCAGMLRAVTRSAFPLRSAAIDETGVCGTMPARPAIWRLLIRRRRRRGGGRRGRLREAVGLACLEAPVEWRAPRRRRRLRPAQAAADHPGRARMRRQKRRRPRSRK